jgi:hypothetical protein
MNNAVFDAVRLDARMEKQAWQTPVLRRSDASDAEGSPGAAMDSPVTTS